MIEIRESDFDGFFRTPFDAYGNDSLYVSPMRGDLARHLSARKNPALRSADELSYFTARRNGRLVGRITAHVHTAGNELHGMNRAYFGYFDCIDDLAVATELLGSAENWARQRKFTEIAGNFNLTAMQQIGVVTSCFDRAPYTDLMWNPPHIPLLLEKCGYSPFFPMTTFENVLALTNPDKLIGPVQQELINSREYTFAPVSRRTIGQRLEEVRGLLNIAFAKNPMFVPVSAEEFEFQSGDMKWIMDPKISAVLHHRDEPVATIICIPDLNTFLRATGSRIGWNTPHQFILQRFRRDRAVLIFSAVRDDMQGKGLNPLVLNKVLTEMKSAGYKTLGGTWIGDTNKASLRQKEKMGARPLHRLHLFRKHLTS